MEKISRWGLSAVAVYVVLIGVLFIYVNTCQSSFCEVASVVATLPWIALLGPLQLHSLEEVVISTSYGYWMFSIGSLFLNIIVLYLFFAWLQKVSKRK